MNDASHSASQEIVVDEVFPHAPETVWKTLTSSDLMGRWLGMLPVGFEPVPGSRFTYQTTPAGLWDGIIHCEVREAIPNQHLVYTWQGGHESNAGYGSKLSTLVTFTLSKVAEGTRLRLVHSGFVLPENDVAFNNMSGGWKKVVGRIDDITTKHVSVEKT